MTRPEGISTEERAATDLLTRLTNEHDCWDEWCAFPDDFIKELEEDIARAIQSAVEAERERSATKAHHWLTDWGADLGATWEAYIEAKRTGIHGGRRIKPQDADLYAKQFRERAEAVADCADHVAAAIRKGA